MKTIMQQLRGIIDWWLQGLTYLVPSYLNNSHIRKNSLVIRFVNELIHFSYIRSDLSKPDYEGVVKLTERAELEQFKHKITANINSSTLIVLLLQQPEVLQKTITMPLTAATNLGDILGFEMDKLTPFKADKLAYDWYVLDKNKQLSTVTFNLFFITKIALDIKLEALKKLNIQPTVITAEGDHEINFLSNKTTRSPQKSLLSTAWLRWSTGITIVSFLLMLYGPLLRYELIIPDMEAEVITVKNQAIAKKKLITERNIITVRQYFLLEKRQSQLQLLEVINELSLILPDDTWLERVFVNEDIIEINGESGSAASIIQTIETSNLFHDAKFNSPITKNQQSDKDRFQLSASIERRVAI